MAYAYSKRKEKRQGDVCLQYHKLQNDHSFTVGETRRRFIYSSTRKGLALCTLPVTNEGSTLTIEAHEKQLERTLMSVCAQGSEICHHPPRGWHCPVEVVVPLLPGKIPKVVDDGSAHAIALPGADVLHNFW
jgi:hypothetical protein